MLGRYFPHFRLARTKGVISCLGYLDDDEPIGLEEDAEIGALLLLNRGERESEIEPEKELTS